MSDEKEYVVPEKGNIYKGSSEVVIRFKATGNAPILKQQVFKITSSYRFSSVIEFLKKQLNFKPQDPIFLYINGAFSPNPDELVANMYKCFSTQGSLIVNYSITAAWG